MLVILSIWSKLLRITCESVEFKRIEVEFCVLQYSVFIIFSLSQMLYLLQKHYRLCHRVFSNMCLFHKNYFRKASVYNLWCVCCQLLPTSQEISAAPECCPQPSEESITCLKPEGPFVYDTIHTRAIFAYFPPYVPVSNKQMINKKHQSSVNFRVYNVKLQYASILMYHTFTSMFVSGRIQ